MGELVEVVRTSVIFFDKDGNRCGLEEAVRCLVRDFDEDGELVGERWLMS